MKRIISGFLTLAATCMLILGCSDEKPTVAHNGSVPGKQVSDPNIARPLAVINLPRGKAYLMNRTIDRGQKRVAVALYLDAPNTTRAWYTLVMQHSGTGSNRTSTFALMNTDSQLLFEHGLVCDWSNPTWGSISERTTTDSMTIRRSVSGGTVEETYIINGVESQLTYSVALDRKMRDSADFLTGEEQEQLSQLAQRFAQFYRTDNSLHNNVYGELLVGLLYNSDFCNWMAQVEPIHAESALYKASAISAEDVCIIADVCAMIKCSVGGGLLNPLCVPCMGVSLACLGWGVHSMLTRWFS